MVERPCGGPVLWLCVMLLVAVSLTSADVPGFSDQAVVRALEAVEKAIEAAKQHIWSRYLPERGRWQEPAAPADPKERSYRGGYTSLACYALLAAGESHQDPRMKRALKWLAGVKMNATYCLGLRAQVWTYLPRQKGRALLARDAKQLIDSICRPTNGGRFSIKSNPCYGTYTYISNGTISGGGDHSNTQFGVLGVWAAAREHMEVPSWYWQLVYKHFEYTQNHDGGWSYGYAGEGDPRAVRSTGTMTGAGLASTFVAFDNLYADKFTKCGRNPAIPPIHRGLRWFDRNFDPAASPGGGPYHYYLYAVERVGLASGYKYFGNKDWYKLGAARLIATQRNGGWGALQNTVFSLLFLVRGRAPVLINRLEYPGDWNNRPRALANLMRWTGRKFEGEVNWQIINLRAPVREWHDAPVLLITGSKKPQLSDEDLSKLRRYVHEGGMLLTIAECKGRGFDFAWKGAPGRPGLYAKLFGDYELKRLPREHPIYKAHFKIRRHTPLWAVTNGVRILALHSFTDLPVHWQTNSYATEADAFELAFNIIYYTTDRASLRNRGISPWPADKPIISLRGVKVARVRYDGNWNPEPLAWTRFALLIGQNWQTSLTSEPVAAEELDAATHRVAAMTGTTAVTFSAGQKKAIKAYIQAGGTLIIDAAGGSEKFADSAVELLEELFEPGCVRRLPAFSPVYNLPGMKIDKVGYRKAALKKLGRVKEPRLMGVTLGRRVAVFLSREDLTSGLVGYPCYSSVGYAPGTVKKPGSAIRLMRNMVLYGNAGRPALAATAAR